MDEIPAGQRLPRQVVARRRRHRPAARRRHRLGWRGWLALAAVAAIVGLLAWGALARRFAPRSNTSLNRFDAIILLGTPADRDGNPTPTELATVNEGVREYERGVAPRLIVTGGAAHNRFVEARVMAQAAHAEGIPESALLVEPLALNTIQNACYAARIMKIHGWQSAEVISQAEHLPRTGLVFSSLPIEWRTHAAAPLRPPSAMEKAMVTVVETLKTVRYLVWARQIERCGP